MCFTKVSILFSTNSLGFLKPMFLYALTIDLEILSIELGLNVNDGLTT